MHTCLGVWVGSVCFIYTVQCACECLLLRLPMLGVIRYRECTTRAVVIAQKSGKSLFM